MTTLREAAQQAMEALRGYRRELGCEQPCDAELALQDALAQKEQEQEPVALKHTHEWFRTGAMDPGQFRCIHCGAWAKETHPPRREWKSLTADAVFANDKIMAVNASLGLKMNQLMDLVCAVEAALKEKNNG